MFHSAHWVKWAGILMEWLGRGRGGGGGAGHEYSAEWVRDAYESQPAIGMYQMPLYATYSFRMCPSSTPATSVLDKLGLRDWS